jgi:hypothetical protein
MIGRHLARRNSSRTPGGEIRRQRNRPAGEDAKRADRRFRVGALRAAGHSFREIARRLRCGTQTAHDDYKAWMAELQVQRVQLGEDFVAMECERLDKMLWALDPRIEAGDVYACDVARKISESRQKLLGLDAPTKISPMTPIGDALPIALDLARLPPAVVDAVVAALESAESGAESDNRNGGCGR